MPFSALNLRLQQLEKNINQILQLLHEYEEELIDEDEPSRRSRYRRRIEGLRQQKSGYEEEFLNLQAQAEIEFPNQTQTLSGKLQRIDEKINLILEFQASLHQALMSHFSLTEQELLSPLTQQLKQPELIKMKAFLEAVDADSVSESDVNLVLAEVQHSIKVAQEKRLSLPTQAEAVAEIVNSPTVDAKHALKVSIPIIPFILAYEGELGLGTGINLKNAWESLMSRFQKE